MVSRTLMLIIASYSVPFNGCAPKIGTVDPAVVPVVKQFKIEAANRGKTVPVDHLDITLVDGFSDTRLDVNTVGVCYDGVENRIELLRSYWIKAASMDRELLLFHELGHCAMGKEHLDCPGGSNHIMCPTMAPRLCYEGHRAVMIDELFQ